MFVCLSVCLLRNLSGNVDNTKRIYNSKINCQIARQINLKNTGHSRNKYIN